MKNLHLILILCIALCVACTKTETDPECVAMRGLVDRVVPEYSKNIVLERLESDSVDRFEIESDGNKLIIRGNNANSMAVGLNHYLKYYCLAQYSWFKEEPLELPTDIMTPIQRHRCMSHIRSRNTKPEIKVRQWLWQHGYRYRLCVKGVPGKPDIVMRKYRTAIFVNGCFWHGHGVQLTVDSLQLTVETGY